MGRQGREALTMESTEAQNISFGRKKGCFLNACSIFALAVVFIAAVLATGLLVYYYTDKPMHSAQEQKPVEYKVVQHHPQNTGNEVKDPTDGKDQMEDGKDMKDLHTHGEEMKDEDSKMRDKKKMDVRIPSSINPLHYEVRLIPFINGNLTIKGYVKLTFEVLEATNKVILHINDIITKNDTIKIMPMKKDGMDEIAIESHMHDQEREFYVAQLKKELMKGKYSIEMEFEGYLNSNMDGFYRSSYKDDAGKTRLLAATQFQPTDARKAFPCMDEPALKANFSITLGRQGNMSSISNMPLMRTKPMEGETDWYWDVFEESVKMSTYLVAFVVSDFKYIQSTDDMKYKFNVWSREAALAQTDYAVSIGPPASRFFEQYFDVPFPLPKQDMIAIPDFSAGAMENWGLITYRETAVLYDPASSRAKDKLYVAAVIVHELAHQWFGNLVTPSWWTDLWLNEGFASYMEYIGTNAVEPSWKMMEMFVVMDLHSVFGLDCLESSHPISTPVHHPDEINEIFDKISYLKGSSIIRMMSHFLTENTFRKGLSKYLTALAYGSAEQDDLWDYLTRQAHTEGTMATNLTVKTIMDTWTLQMGFPVINIASNEDGTLTLTQERFLLVKHNASSSSDDYKWWVPITYTTQSNPDFSSTKPKLWMMPSEATKTIAGVPSNGWVIFNTNQTGYYRVNYDAKNWEMIVKQLQMDHTLISPINRAQIIDDSMALARAGLLSYEIVFKVLSYLPKEKDYVPWKAALNGLSFIKAMFTHTGGYGALNEFIMSLIKDRYNHLGFEDSLADPFLDQLLRADILSQACAADHTPCVEQSVGLFSKWMQDPNNYALISANLKLPVYCTALKEGGYKEWKFAWDRYEHSNVGSEKRTILSALGCSKETWILNGYIERSISKDKGIRKQDTSTVVGAVADSDIGRSVAWEFLKDKWTDIRVYFGSVSFTLNRIIKSVTGSLNTENHLKELKDFAEKHKGSLGSAKRSTKQSLEHVQNNLNWMNNNYQTILNWLNKNEFRSNV